ncbi:MarR family transcriptional regulator [Kribbella sp. NPDC050281]|uniref:MarR family winged helix-turn-helix transcriptional regulator n=1 Tax=Kribbella sp. NPDC050281 TaxID=3155515 RepID=UPI00340CBA1D
MTPSSSQAIVRDRFQRLLPRLMLLYSEVAKSAGISEVALLALHVLTLHDGPMYPSEVSAQTGLPRSTVTRVLDALEDAGYVARTKAPEDGRRFAVSVRRERVAPISARFDLYAEAMGEAMLAFTEEELAVVARYWDVLSRAIHDRQPDAAG